MKKLTSLEIEKSLITNTFKVPDGGHIVYLEDNKVVFISANKIGIFSKKSLKEFREDLSKLEHVMFTLVEIPDEIHTLDSAYVTPIQ